MRTLSWASFAMTYLPAGGPMPDSSSRSIAPVRSSRSFGATAQPRRTGAGRDGRFLECTFHRSLPVAALRTGQKRRDPAVSRIAFRVRMDVAESDHLHADLYARLFGLPEIADPCVPAVLARRHDSV